MKIESQLLDIWERGYGRGLLERALLLSRLAMPMLSDEELLDMPVGKRDGNLMNYRSSLFGANLVSRAECPRCGEIMEVAVNLNELRLMEQQFPERAVPLMISGKRLTCRLPSSRDLIAIEQLATADRQLGLMLRCLDSEYKHGLENPLGIEQCELDQAFEELERLDPLSDIQFRVVCRQCGDAAEVTFDIVSFLWTEISVVCQRLVGEVHLLASLYGWTQSEILSLTPWRRQIYVNLIRQ